jgi:hypothetical protein
VGQEAKCSARILGKQAEGRLQLETDKLMFRGPGARLDLSIGDISAAKAEHGKLVVRAKRETFEFDLGDAAARWAHKIMNPKSLVDKLGVKPGDSVVYLGAADEALVTQLKKAEVKLATRRSGSGHDWVFVGAEKPADLLLLDRLDAIVKPNGGIWVVFPKGLPDLKDITVIAAGKSFGFVGTKVARVSDRLTGMKLVIPVARRK